MDVAYSSLKNLVKCLGPSRSTYTYCSWSVMMTWGLLQTIMNAHGVGEVALAGATSNLFAMLADSYRRSKSIKPGDEIIIHDSSHEVKVCPLFISIPV